MVPKAIKSDGDGIDDVDAEDFRTGHGRAGEDELDVPAPEAQRPVSRRARVGHREGQAVARLGDGHLVLVELLVLEGRG